MRWHNTKKILLEALWGVVIAVPQTVVVIRVIRHEIGWASAITALFIMQILLLLGVIGISYTYMMREPTGDGNDGTE